MGRKFIGNLVGVAITAYRDTSAFFNINDKYYFSRAKGIAGGVELMPGNGYKYHIFTSPGTLQVESTISMEFIVVAGGGSGGPGVDAGASPGPGGGGGAGGYRSIQQVVNDGSYTVTVGAAGNPSSFASITSTAGGNGGTGGGISAGSPGGSGGGGGNGRAGGTGNTPPTTPPQGNPGQSPGAGGGAGPTSPNGLPAFSGDSGIPASYGTPGPSPGRWFAGGGGGAFGAAGGAGGGGAGAFTSPAVPGGGNTGGGGGAGYAPMNTSGASGGSGIVIIRYAL